MPKRSSDNISSNIQEDDHSNNPHINELENARNKQIDILQREKEDMISKIAKTKEEIINFYTDKREKIISQFSSEEKESRADLIRQKLQITDEYIDIEEKLNAEYEESQRKKEDKIKSLNLEEIKFNEGLDKDRSEIIKKTEETQISITKAQALIDGTEASEELYLSSIYQEVNIIKSSYKKEIDKVEANYLSEVRNIEERFKANKFNDEEDISLVKEIKKIITDKETIDFFMEKQVYESIKSLNSSLKTNSDLRLDRVSDEEVKILAEKLLIADGDVVFFTRILKGGKDFINENLDNIEKEQKIWEFFNTILNRHIAYGEKIHPSDVLKIFIDSNLSFKGKSDKLILKAMQFRNHRFLIKLIKEDPEYFMDNPDKTHDIFNRCVKLDLPKMALDVFLATSGGWDINKKDKDGNTALHLINDQLNSSRRRGGGDATLRSQKVMVNTLLLLGADPRITNAKGELPGHNLKNPLFDNINKLLREYRDKKNSIEGQSGEGARSVDNYRKVLLSLPRDREVSKESGERIDRESRRVGEEGIEEEVRGEGGIQGEHIEKSKQVEYQKYYFERKKIRDESLESSLNTRIRLISDLRSKIKSIEENPVPIILEKFKDNLIKLEGEIKEIEKRKLVFDDNMRKSLKLVNDDWEKDERERSERLENSREKAKREIERIDELLETIKQEKARELEKLKLEEARKLEKENEVEISRIYDEEIEKINYRFNLRKQEILMSYEASSRGEASDFLSHRPNGNPKSSSGQVTTISEESSETAKLRRSGRKTIIKPVVREAMEYLKMSNNSLLRDKY